jgi:UDP-glucose 4-epimerase
LAEDFYALHLDLIEKKLTNKKVLVTGATGFIGSHLVERLVNLNARVVAVGPSLGWRPTVARFVQEKRACFVKLQAFWNPSSIERVRSSLQGTDYVVHLAYVMPRGESHLERTVDDIRRNVLGSMQFMRLLPPTVLKICFASSTKVYGPNPPLPVSETHPVDPLSIYSTGKCATENYLRIHARETGISIAILRYATVYGPMETDPRAIPNFIRRVLDGRPPVIYGSGNDICDYVHVNDVADATLLALACDIGNIQVFNIGSGEGYTTRDIAERIINLTGKPLEPNHVSGNHVTSKTICDITQAKNILGYQPRMELNAGLMDEIDFFSKNPKLWRG